jgi:hypothetical protein
MTRKGILLGFLCLASGPAAAAPQVTLVQNPDTSGSANVVWNGIGANPKAYLFVTTETTSQPYYAPSAGMVTRRATVVASDGTNTGLCSTYKPNLIDVLERVRRGSGLFVKWGLYGVCTDVRLEFGYAQPAPPMTSTTSAPVQISGDFGETAFGLLPVLHARNDGSQIKYGVRYRRSGEKTPLLWGYLSARDPAGRSTFCATTDEPMIKAITRIDGDSNLSFSTDHAHECTRIVKTLHTDYPAKPSW